MDNPEPARATNLRHNCIALKRPKNMSPAHDCGASGLDISVGIPRFDGIETGNMIGQPDINNTTGWRCKRIGPKALLNHIPSGLHTIGVIWVNDLAILGAR